MSDKTIRTKVGYFSEKDAISAALIGILEHLGLEVIKYEAPGFEMDTSHGRSYWSRGEIKYVVEKKGQVT